MRRTVTAVVAVLSCVLAGCGGDAESDDTPPASPSSSSSSSAEPSDDASAGNGSEDSTPDGGNASGDSTPDAADDAPELPDAAREATLEGAEAFIRHYVDLLNYASDTGDTRPLKTLSSVGCGGCYDYIHLYEKVYNAGGFLRGGDWVPQQQVFNQRHDGAVRIVITVDAQSGSYRKRPSAEVQEHGKAQYSLTFDVDWRSGTWKVAEFTGSET